MPPCARGPGKESCKKCHRPATRGRQRSDARMRKGRRPGRTTPSASEKEEYGRCPQAGGHVDPDLDANRKIAPHGGSPTGNARYPKRGTKRSGERISRRSPPSPARPRLSAQLRTSPRVTRSGGRVTGYEPGLSPDRRGPAVGPLGLSLLTRPGSLGAAVFRIEAQTRSGVERTKKPPGGGWAGLTTG